MAVSDNPVSDNRSEREENCGVRGVFAADRLLAGGDLLGVDEIPERRSASHGEAGYPRRAFDFYPTEPWVTRALLAAVPFGEHAGPRGDVLIWEPACGDGRMARELDAAGYRVVSSDIADHGYGVVPLDFLGAEALQWALPRPFAIVTNPPFDLAARFIARALELTRPVEGQVAILQRHEFDAPRGNRKLFAWPFAQKLILPRRPRWSDGPDKASPRFPYAWYLWDWLHEGRPVIRWIDEAAAAAPAGGLL